MDELLKPLAMFAISAVGSAVQGAAMKHKTSMDNDRIPAISAVTWGGGMEAFGRMTGDPGMGLMGFAGALTSNLLHWGLSKIFKK